MDVGSPSGRARKRHPQGEGPGPRTRPPGHRPAWLPGGPSCWSSCPRLLSRRSRGQRSRTICPAPPSCTGGWWAPVRRAPCPPPPFCPQPPLSATAECHRGDSRGGNVAPALGSRPRGVPGRSRRTARHGGDTGRGVRDRGFRTASGLRGVRAGRGLQGRGRALSSPRGAPRRRAGRGVQAILPQAVLRAASQALVWGPLTAGGAHTAPAPHPLHSCSPDAPPNPGTGCRHMSF